jgi:hypothetical protein
MTKSAFIAWLQTMPGEPEVMAWDPDEADWFPVTGATYDWHHIKLYTDEDGEPVADS